MVKEKTVLNLIAYFFISLSFNCFCQTEEINSKSEIVPFTIKIENGILDGSYVEYDENGDISIEGYLKNSKKDSL